MSVDISVIIPVYRTEESLLRRCLESIESQSRKGIEVWLIFDGDESNNPGLVRSFWDRGMDLHYEVCAHIGVSAARNRGIGNASGKWVVFVDADDWLETDALERLCNMAEKKKADVVMAEHWTEHGSRTERHVYRKKSALFAGDKKWRFTNDVLNPQTGAGFVWGKMFRRDFLQENGLQFCEELSVAEDAEFMFRVSEAAERIVYMRRPLYHYWYHVNSVVRSYREDYAKRYVAAMQEIRRVIDMTENAPLYQDAYNGCVVYHLLLIAVNYSFHPESGKRMIEQLREFRALAESEPFAEALKTVSCDGFSFTRRVTVRCMRLRLYILVCLIAKIRHIQNRGIKKK